METVRRTNRRPLSMTITLVAALLVSATGATHSDALAGSTVPGVLMADSGQTNKIQTASPLSPVGSGFTYQGQLKQGGNPANGQYDFMFKLYDALSGGTQVGSTLNPLNQTVTNGLFTVLLDFGSASFQGEGRWLEIAVRPVGGGTYTTLSPRQALTATPYASSLMPGAVVSGSVQGPVFVVTNTVDGGIGLQGANTGTTGMGVRGQSISGYGGYFLSSTGIGLYGASSNYYGVWGVSDNNNGVVGRGGGSGAGVWGYSIGSGDGVYGSSNNNGIGVHGASASSYGVYGEAGVGTGVGGITTNGGYGVFGQAPNGGWAVRGETTTGYGLYGSATTGTGATGVTTNGGYGVFGQAPNGGWAVRGESNVGYGVYGLSPGGNGIGVYGSGALHGVYGISSNHGAGMWGECTFTNCTGVQGVALTGYAIAGSTQSGYAIFGQAPNGGWAGYFSGNVRITGSCCAMGIATTQIDHPLDPTTKYLNQSLVQSPDMLSMLNGNTTTDAKGEAVIELPDYFEAANKDFRYQLTVIGQFAQAIVGSELSNNRFAIKTDKAHVKVSWEVSGVRKDPYALAHPLQPETLKPADEQGKYLHPKELGQPESKGIDYERAREVEKQTTENHENK